MLQVTNYKKVEIKGKVELDGKLQEIEITKFDKKNNVVAFNIKVMGKDFYVGAGAETPKLSEVQDITISLKD